MKKYLFALSTLALLGCANQSQDSVPEQSTAPKPTAPRPDFKPNSPELTQCQNPNPSSKLLRTATLVRTNPAISEAGALFRQQSNRVNAAWGKDGYIQSTKHRYVKYLDSFKTRADIHFDTGKIFVSTIDKNNSIEKLKTAITQVVLLPPNPEHIDLFGDKEIVHSKTPFFLGQILDQNGKPMDTEAQAMSYAEHIVANQLKEKKFVTGSAKYVEISLVKNHQEIREYQYADIVKETAKRYNISEDLIYGIIRTESSFNPYAVSHAGAIGLMQVVPKTAGADVFALIKNKEGIPSEDYLFDPANNIDTGVAYLSILQDRYLKDITDKASRHFSMISAYNGGTGNVLMTFDNDRTKAKTLINQTNPRQVYCILSKHHPKEESRNYLNKVLRAQNDFNINEV